MLHEPAQDHGEDPAASYKMRLGVYMFIAYAAFYAGFVIINVVNAKLMEMEVLLGLNLAVVYGLGLIVVALILALIYNHLCTSKENSLAATSSADKNSSTEEDN